MIKSVTLSRQEIIELLSDSIIYNYIPSDNKTISIWSIDSENQPHEVEKIKIEWEG
jgi:hypothetical protein